MDDSKASPGDAALVAPEWEPPAHLELRDPLVARVNVLRVDWKQATKRRMPGLAEHAIALALADHGNPDGSRIFPGVALLAEELDTTEKTVKKAMAWLLEHGWLELVARGVRKLGKANRYQLTMPAPLAAEWGKQVTVDGKSFLVPYWTAANGPQWIERPADDDARHASRAPVDPVEVPARYRVTRVSRAPVELSTAPGGVVVEGREVPPPSSYHSIDYQASPTARPHSDERGRTSRSDLEDKRAERRADYPTNNKWIDEDDPDQMIWNIDAHVQERFGEVTGLHTMLQSKITPPVDPETFEELPFTPPDPRHLMNMALKAGRWGTVDFDWIDQQEAAGKNPGDEAAPDPWAA